MLRTILFALTSLMSMALLADETSGNPAEIYHDFCSVCHGDTGQGAVWAQSGLDPLPADFTDPQVWMRLNNRDRMVRAVTYGIPQTAMAGWGNRLSEQDIAVVVDFVRDTFMDLSLIPDYETPPETMETDMDMAKDGDAHDHDAHGADELNAPFENGLKGDLFAGEKLYNLTCAECHGVQGDGKGPRAYFVFPKPRDFHDPAAKATYSRSHLFNATAKGVLGTEMPAWDKVLSNQELADISEYIFETYIAARNPLNLNSHSEAAPAAGHGKDEHAGDSH